MLPAQRFGVSSLQHLCWRLGKAILHAVSLADQGQGGTTRYRNYSFPVHTLHMAVEEERLRVRRNTYRMVSTFTEAMAH